MAAEEGLATSEKLKRRKGDQHPHPRRPRGSRGADLGRHAANPAADRLHGWGRRRSAEALNNPDAAFLTPPRARQWLRQTTKNWPAAHDRRSPDRALELDGARYPCRWMARFAELHTGQSLCDALNGRPDLSALPNACEAPADSERGHAPRLRHTWATWFLRQTKIRGCSISAAGQSGLMAHAIARLRPAMLGSRPKTPQRLDFTMLASRAEAPDRAGTANRRLRVIKVRQKSRAQRRAFIIWISTIREYREYINSYSHRRFSCLILIQYFTICKTSVIRSVRLPRVAAATRLATWNFRTLIAAG